MEEVCVKMIPEDVISRVSVYINKTIPFSITDVFP